ncbi:hypothetical protein RHSIM_Rhsim11G0120600 [Rhododendron simsii]|uniref:Uncharacterized protein n=1 Tax=Rhododendron simsii TaxID=118357 RepID=A0A834G6Q0_RHOSS|nr:hypothetical protein RHSIM_Rhsim11G0120600 [Rhododendron simsii]
MLDMLGNLGLLKELIVEDCPKIRSLVTRADANVSGGHFCRSLRKIALLDLPQLVTISGPLCLGEEVDSLFVYNCPMLKSLDTAETSPKYCKIVGEKEWGDSLRWHDSEWSRLTQPAFEELRTDEHFMDQLIMVASWKALVTRDWEKANGDLKPRNYCRWPTAEYISADIILPAVTGSSILWFQGKFRSVGLGWFLTSVTWLYGITAASNSWNGGTWSLALQQFSSFSIDG